MQRCFFFIILCLAGAFVSAQNVDVRNTEISYWFDAISGADGVLKAEAVLQLETTGPADSIFLLAKGLHISTVRRREGRLKGEVAFRQKGDSLWVFTDFPQEGMSLFFKYEIPLIDPQYDRYVQRTPEFMAFNPFNIGSGAAAGLAGHFYPALPGDPSRIKANLTFGKGKNSSAPGTLDFITDNQNGTLSHYWSSKAEFAPEQFFLIIGKFEESEEEELEEEFDFIALDLTKQKAQQVKPLVEGAVNYLDLSLTDSQYVRMDSLARAASFDYFLEKEDVADVDSRQFTLEQWLFANYASDSANDKFLDFYRNKKGDDWYFGLMQRHYEDSAYSRFFWEKYLDLFLQQCSPRRSLADTAMIPAWQHPYGNQFQAMVSVARQVYQKQAPLEVAADYRYVADEGALYIYLSQPDSAVDLTLPIQIDVVTSRQNIVRTVMPRLRMSDTIRIELSESPKYVGTVLGYDLGALDNYENRLNPVHYTQNRPDTYLLYALANARNPQTKRTALAELLETENPNLFSTVLGIAMDDDEVSLRLQALRRAGNLTPSAQRKLEDTIKSLAQNDPNAAVRDLAQELVGKYYTD